MKDNSQNIMSKDYDMSYKSDTAKSIHNLNKVRKIMGDRKKILKQEKKENKKFEEEKRIYMERKQRIGVEFRESQQTSKRSSNRLLPENQ